LTALIVIIGIAYIFLNGVLCGSEVFQEVLSPNSKYKVVVYERNCGATTGFSTNISIIDGHISLLGGVTDRPGNIFQADGYPDWFEINVKWENNTRLVIEHNGKPIPYYAEENIQDVKIEYIENRENILPPRPFAPSELLIPVNHFPQGWTGEEHRPLGPEVIKGSKDNNPYMLYTPPSPAKYSKAGHYVRRLDNVDQALEYFQRELKTFQKNYSTTCIPSGLSPSEEALNKSEYSQNFAIGYAEHEYTDGSGEPNCKLIAQYDEFFIQFSATISQNGLTYEQFNNLGRIIDQIMTEHLQE